MTLQEGDVIEFREDRWVVDRVTYYDAGDQWNPGPVHTAIRLIRKGAEMSVFQSPKDNLLYGNDYLGGDAEGYEKVGVARKAWIYEGDEE